MQWPLPPVKGLFVSLVIGRSQFQLVNFGDSPAGSLCNLLDGVIAGLLSRTEPKVCVGKSGSVKLLVEVEPGKFVGTISSGRENQQFVSCSSLLRTACAHRRHSPGD
jgi:hypothetical protein